MSILTAIQQGKPFAEVQKLLSESNAETKDGAKQQSDNTELNQALLFLLEYANYAEDEIIKIIKLLLARGANLLQIEKENKVQLLILAGKMSLPAVYQFLLEQGTPPFTPQEKADLTEHHLIQADTDLNTAKKHLLFTDFEFHFKLAIDRYKMIITLGTASQVKILAKVTSVYLAMTAKTPKIPADLTIKYYSFVITYCLSPKIGISHFVDIYRLLILEEPKTAAARTDYYAAIKALANNEEFYKDFINFERRRLSSDNLEFCLIQDHTKVKITPETKQIEDKSLTSEQKKIKAQTDHELAVKQKNEYRLKVLFAAPGYYCEIAEAALSNNNFSEALQHFARVLILCDWTADPTPDPILQARIDRQKLRISTAVGQKLAEIAAAEKLITQTAENKEIKLQQLNEANQLLQQVKEFQPRLIALKEKIFLPVREKIDEKAYNNTLTNFINKVKTEPSKALKQLWLSFSTITTVKWSTALSWKILDYYQQSKNSKGLFYAAALIIAKFPNRWDPACDHGQPIRKLVANATDGSYLCLFVLDFIEWRLAQKSLPTDIQPETLIWLYFIYAGEKYTAIERDLFTEMLNVGLMAKQMHATKTAVPAKSSAAVESKESVTATEPKTANKLVKDKEVKKQILEYIQKQVSKYQDLQQQIQAFIKTAPPPSQAILATRGPIFGAGKIPAADLSLTNESDLPRDESHDMEMGPVI